MTLVSDARLAVWYRLRRQTRRFRRHSADQRFAEVVATLQPGDLCVDCGANIGSITLQIAATGATVHAFEPDPDAYAVLARNCAGLPNVVLHNAAVAVASGPHRLYRGRPSPSLKGTVSQGSTLFEGKVNVSADRHVDVATTNFIAFLRSLGAPVALIKMDVEGAEVDLLNALLDENLQDEVGNIFAETHEKQIPSLRRETMQLVRRCRPHRNIHLDWG